jgi:hypothetical protein
MIRSFSPPRRNGLAFQAPVGLLLLVGAALAFLQSSRVAAGPELLVYLLLGLLLLAPLPLLGYRIYALLRARYLLERDGLHLIWGLRTEDIPLTEIEWVRPVSDLVRRLPLPLLNWPGAILGARQVRGLGLVEFMAADVAHMVLIGTPHKVYAISPANPSQFLRVFQSMAELGSLTPIPAASVFPRFLVEQTWADPIGRILLVSSMILELVLLTWVTLSIPGRQTISLGFSPNVQPAEPGPSARLMLLPVLNTINLIFDLAAGFFFFRRPEQVPLAYLLWGSAVVSPLLLLIAVFYILR